MKYADNLFFFLMALCLLAGCQSDSVKDSIERQLKEYPETRVTDIYKYFCRWNSAKGILVRGVRPCGVG